MRFELPDVEAWHRNATTVSASLDVSQATSAISAASTAARAVASAAAWLPITSTPTSQSPPTAPIHGAVRRAGECRLRSRDLKYSNFPAGVESGSPEAGTVYYAPVPHMTILDWLLVLLYFAGLFGVNGVGRLGAG